MERIDIILNKLKDSQWHSCDEIKEHVALSDDALKIILKFLNDDNFIIYEMPNKRAKIKPLGLRFLELKSE